MNTKEELKRAYIEAEQDEESQKVIAEWSVLELEGWEEAADAMDTSQ